MDRLKIETKYISKSIKCIICQKKIGVPLSNNEKEEIRESRADFLCLPELFFINDKIRNYEEASYYYDECKEYIRNLSDELNLIVIGGTLITKDEGRLKSISYVFSKGKELGKYIKVNLTEKEKIDGFVSGDKYNYFFEKGIKFSVLICNDIFDERGFFWAKNNGVEIIFMPTGSPYKSSESVKEKFERDERLYVGKAKLSNSIIIKVCGVGKIFDLPLQGRSLIASPEGIIFRVHPDKELQESLIEIELRKM